jgi:hypothetical protein
MFVLGIRRMAPLGGHELPRFERWLIATARFLY